MKRLIIAILLILSFAISHAQVVIQTDFFGSGAPNATAKSSIRYIDVAKREKWKQITMPQGNSWQLEASNILVDFGYIGGVLPIIKGGTGATTATTALTNLLPSQTGNAGEFLQTNGTVTSWAAAGGGAGTVTSFSFTNGGGFTGIVTNPTTTPTLGLTLTATGVVAGNYTNTNLTVNAGGQITAASNGSAGGVTSVGATAPITSSGGATPTISTSMTTNRLIGRATAGTGVMEEITLGTGLSFTGTTLNAASGGGEDLAATLVIGNTTGGTNIILSAGDNIGNGAGAGLSTPFGVQLTTTSGDQLLDMDDGTLIELRATSWGASLLMSAGETSLDHSTKVSVIAPVMGVNSLGGVGTRMVTADATGVLSTAAIPTGTVTSIATTSPITGGTITGTGTIAINNAAADGSTKGAASFTAADFDATAGNISIDYVNGQRASVSTQGFLSSTDWTTFNNKQGTISVTSPITLTGASVGMVNQGTATTVLHGNAAGNPAFSSVVEADLGLTDITTANVSSSAHGFAPKGDGTTTNFLNGNATYTKPLSGDLVYADASVPAGNTIANTTSATAFTSSYTIPANTVGAGTVVRVRAEGVYSTDALLAPSLTGQLKIGSVVLATSGAVTTIVGVTNKGWTAWVDFIVTDPDATGIVESQGYAEFATAATTSLTVNMSNTAAISGIDFTANQALTIVITWGTADADNTITLRTAKVYIDNVSLSTITAAGGDLTGTYPNPTIKSSVALSGSPTTTTQAAGTNNTTIATTAYADALTRSYCLNGSTLFTTANPADGATYYFRETVSLTTITGADVSRIYFPQAGTIIACRVIFTQNAGSAQTSTFYLRLNNTTDITVSSAVTNDAGTTTFINTGLSQAVNATTDYVEPKWICPTWTPTNPTSVQARFQILVKPN